MNDSRTGFDRLHMPRSRGAVSGLLLIILGAWGALIPFVGPYFEFAYPPDQAWAWTAARGWLEVFPGVTTVVGGVLLVGSRNRATAMFGGWLAAFAGAWFVVGGAFAPTLRISGVGQPLATTDLKRAVLEICYFSGLGALIVFLAGAVLARLAVRMARDVELAPAPVANVPREADVPPEAEMSAPVAAPVASPDAQTRPRAEEHPAPERHRHPKGSLFRRRHASASGH